MFCRSSGESSGRFDRVTSPCVSETAKEKSPHDDNLPHLGEELHFMIGEKAVLHNVIMVS